MTPAAWLGAMCCMLCVLCCGLTVCAALEPANHHQTTATTTNSSSRSSSCDGWQLGHRPTITSGWSATNTTSSNAATLRSGFRVCATRGLRLLVCHHTYSATCSSGVTPCVAAAAGSSRRGDCGPAFGAQCPLQFTRGSPCLTPVFDRSCPWSTHSLALWQARPGYGCTALRSTCRPIPPPAPGV